MSGSESAHLLLLLARSRRRRFDESSDSDDSTTTDAQIELIDRRRARDVPRCTTIPSDPRLVEALAAAHARGELAVRATTLRAPRRALRADPQVREVFPRWFVLLSALSSWEACEAIVRYLEEQHGAEWPAAQREYIAACPRDAPPTLQNLRSDDFMHVSMLSSLRANGRCEVRDIYACLDKLSPSCRAKVVSSEDGARNE